ncbi:MAG: transposase [Candidatus Daviesbacteria bacterium]|nr:transposase [Candidatus Daviesbacteria bacterium]
MPYRTTPLVADSFYHVYNRGVEKRIIFLDERDYQRFLQTLYYYQFTGPKPAFSARDKFQIKDFSTNPKIVEIICYCLMPNHFHLLIKQLKDNGISEFIGKVINSYTKYFNTKHKRVGPLLQGTFKTVLVDDNFQFMHLSRYIHLNPYVDKLVENLEVYEYSSYPQFIGLTTNLLSVPQAILSLFKDGNDYKEFVVGHADYARELAHIKHILIENFEE